MAVAFHGLHKLGQRRLQPLPADTVGCLPHQDYRLPHFLVVYAPALDSGHLSPRVDWLFQQPNAVLPVMAGHRDELVKDPALVLLGRALVAVLY